MTTTTSILKLIHMTDDEYWKEYLSRYMKWCLQFSQNKETDLQKLLANTAINNYYTARHEDLEHQAIQILKPQDGKITTELARRLYADVMVDLFTTFPKPLFDAARKLNVIGNQN
ncbi:hypothetical protein [Flavobacterium cerinum]|uniref:Uncharacterized protein n=1 Tax=Flavobacterium cerinum TaxID=2502784 RepID=A0A444HBU3_9FLAO|nr:hypothetical protein [Flavobacterium cerinum]RWX00950.1 hypothetical protein EPI11_07975 [Flavobacterium cerinum]